MYHYFSILIYFLFFVSQLPIKQAFAEQTPAVLVLTLDQCIELALEKNPGLRVEREKIAELENDYLIAASALYPRLSLSASYQRLDGERVGILPQMAYEEETLAQAKAKQVLFDGGKSRNSRIAALKAGDAQKESAGGTRFDTAFAVSQAYYRVLEAREILQVSETSFEQREAFYKLTESFLKAGKATRLESLRAEAQFLDGSRSLSQAREAYRLSELILKKVMGIGLETGIQIANSLPTEFPEPATEDVLMPQTLAGNPDLKKIVLLKEQAEAAMASSQGSYWPEISLQGTFGYRDRDTSAWDSEWTAGVFLEWPLFEGGLTRAQVGKARSKLNQAGWNEKAVRDQVQVDLSEALGNMRTAAAAVASSRRLVEAQDEAYKAAVAFYKQGRSTYIEVLTAQGELTQAKASYVRAVGDYQNAGARLNRIMGKNSGR